MSLLSRYSRRQWIIFSLICVANLVNGFCVSVQSPFYPREAEFKGATPSQYGLVFGVYALIVFIISPVHGMLIPVVGARFTTVMGMFIVTVTCLLFGFIDEINDTSTFLIYSFLIRIFEATGTVGFKVGSTCIIMSEFCDDVGFGFSASQTFFGLGLTVGPTVGGVFYEIGGFILPFLVIGVVLLITTLSLILTLPYSEETLENKSSRSLFHMFKSPEMILAMLTIFGGFLIIGMLQPLLEPHLRTFNLSPIQIGLMFIANGASYSISSIFWGKICDMWKFPHYIWLIGCTLLIISLSLLGPSPYLHFPFTLPVAIISLILTGLGYGAQLIAGFYCFNQVATNKGYGSNLNTLSFISAVFGSLSSLGTFVGASLGGVLYEEVGFVWAVHLLVIYQVIIFVLTTTYHLYLNKCALELTCESNIKLIDKKNIE